MRKFFTRAAVPITVAAALLAAPALASADSPSSLTVVGTSDVSDSGLIQNVIEPAFNAAYPNITFKYIGQATGTAISDAESGSVGASMLIVHAASLENQFVGSGYSYQNKPGYAVFRNDFVLAGPSTADPAAITSDGDTHNVVAAFMDIARAGINGDATFVSRGGTPGTTVAEHQIWAQVESYETANPTDAISHLYLCQVSTAAGGGYTPVASSTYNDAACPSDITATGNSDVPSWYSVTGQTQGPNVLTADACTTTGYVPNACYVFTDRGTYDYLASGQDPAGSLSGSNSADPLNALVYNNSATAPGGADLLVNYFHAYIVNPTKVTSAGVNLTASQDLVDLLTSPALQAKLSNYLVAYNTYNSSTKTYSFALNPLGAPFVADASPQLTESGLKATVNYGKTVTVDGTLTNAEIGYPALTGQKVTVDELIAGVPVAVASAKTSSTGTYSVKFTPRSTGEYEVATGQITQVENGSLSPTFSDILSPASTDGVPLKVIGSPVSHAVGIVRARITAAGRVTVTGSLHPAPALSGAKVELIATNTSTGRSKQIGSAIVAVGKTSFVIRGKLAKGHTYVLQLKYVQANQTTAYSAAKRVVVR